MSTHRAALWAFHIDRVPSREEIKRLSRCLPEPDRARIDRFVQDVDAYRSLLGRLLPRAILCSSPFSMRPSDVEIRRTARGRPFLASQVHGFQFDYNDSHDNDYVVCAFHYDSVDAAALNPIGVDVMKDQITFGRSTELFETMEDLMTEHEANAYRDLYDEAETTKLHHLLRLWTCKEALSKAQGLGLSANFKAMDFTLGSSSTPQTVLRMSGVIDPLIRVIEIDIHPNYFVTMILPITTEITVQVSHVNLQQILGPLELAAQL